MTAPFSEVRADASRVVGRIQAALNFSVAVALQTALNTVLSAGEQLAVLVLLCVLVQEAAKLTRLDSLRSVLVVQVGQTLQGLLVYKNWASGSTLELAQGFLINTLGLCVPSVLELLSPQFMQSEYVQSALSVWLYQYATATREVLMRVDFGVSSAVVCLLAFALAAGAQRVAGSDLGGDGGLARLYKYVVRAWHMLLVNWLLRTLTLSIKEAPTALQIAMLAMVIIVVDALALESFSMLRDVRGYTVFRIAGELQGLGVLSSDRTSALAAALVAFCAHTGLGRLGSRVTTIAAEVFFVASANVFVQSVQNGAEAGAQQVLRAGLVCVLTYALQAVLNNQTEHVPRAPG